MMPTIDRIGLFVVIASVFALPACGGGDDDDDNDAADQTTDDDDDANPDVGDDDDATADDDDATVDDDDDNDTADDDTTTDDDDDVVDDDDTTTDDDDTVDDDDTTTDDDDVVADDDTTDDDDTVLPPSEDNVGDECDPAAEGTCTSACVTIDGATFFCTGDCGEHTCPDGYACAVLGDPIAYGCIPANEGAGETGSECADPSECVNSMCAADVDGSQYCIEPCAQDQCPDGFYCYTGGDGLKACFKKGIVPTGQNCGLDDECEGGKCARPDENDPSLNFCSTACGADAECPEHYGCTDGVCMPNHSGELNEGCMRADECGNDICVGIPTGGSGVCSTTCTDSDCPDGMSCIVSLDAADAYLCSVSGSGGKGLGEDCLENDECTVPMCAGDIDGSSYCIIDCKGGTCPDDFYCYEFDTGRGACFKKGVQHTGGSCTLDDECAGGLCLGKDEGNGLCTLPCTADTDCPAHYGCTANACQPNNSGKTGEECEIAAECESNVCNFPPDADFTGPEDPPMACALGCPDGSCPDGQVCVSDFGSPANYYCSTSAGTKQTGEACDFGEDCASGVCEIDPATQAFACTEVCPAGNGCGDGRACYDSFGTRVCGTAGAGETGSSCVEDNGCKGGVCVDDGNGGGYCATKCTDTCDAGYECKEGICVTDGSKADGAECVLAGECQSGRCDADGDTKMCVVACNPDGDAICGAGKVCVPDDGGSGSCLTERALGEACSSDAVCTHLGPDALCYIDLFGTGLSYCSQFCETTCPDGFTCVEDFLFGPVCQPAP